MSRVKQLADEEAEAVEAEETEEVDGAITEDAYADGVEPPDVDDGPSLESSLKEYEKENTRHTDTLARIMGEDWEAMAYCEQCNGVGFRPSDPYKRDPNLTTCDACGGYGILVTGSLNPDKAVQACQTCGGNGFVTKPLPQPAQPFVAPPVMYDPHTGLPVQPVYAAPGAPPSPNGEWAPGFVPPPQPLPQRP